MNSNEAITKVYLLNVPLENDYKNTLYFANASAQQSYFSSRVVKSYASGSNGFTYQRKDGVLRIPEIYDNLYNCNYVMYQNSNYSNKWFYAFIKDMQYINDGRTDIYIETDVIQTWLFDYTVKSSFVEREHVNDDTVGLHTFPEQLETGDYILQPTELNERESLNFLHEDVYICMATTSMYPVPSGAVEHAPDHMYNNVYSGLTYIVFPDAAEAGSYITACNKEFSDTGGHIQSIFMVPEHMVTDIEGFQWSTATEHDITFEYAFVLGDDRPATLSSAIISKPDHLDADYIPRNNKLLCYPYRYFMLNNSAGDSTIYHYEGFRGSVCRMFIEGAIGVGCSIQAFPTDYYTSTEFNYTEEEYTRGLPAGKLPTCAWVSDAFTNWLTANAVNLGVGFAEDVVQIGAGAVGLAAGGAGAGSIVSGVSGIASKVGQIYSYSKAPGAAHGQANNGDLAAARKESFKLYKKSIRKEYAQIIDGFFDMFGYQVNTVKVPNSNHRARWWYTKTIDVNIDGAIPNNDMQIIKNAYNSGITFWRNASEIQNYSLSNGIV